MWSDFVMTACMHFVVLIQNASTLQFQQSGTSHLSINDTKRQTLCDHMYIH